MSKVISPLEPKWSIDQRRRAGDFAMDLSHCSPNDPEVLEAKEYHVDFWCPIGLYYWNRERQDYDLIGPYSGYVANLESCQGR